MKKIFGFMVICATLALLSLPVLAHEVYARVDETMQDPCSTEGKTALYAEFYKEIKADQAKAYEAARKYVACPPDTTEQPQEAKDAEAKRVEYLKGFIAKFEKARRKDQFNEAVAKNEYAKAFELGKLFLADEPNNTKAIMEVALAGAVAQLSPGETVGFAQKALQMIESGQAPTTWGPQFENKDDAVTKLNYAIGTLKVKDNPEQAIPFLIKAASFGKLKNNPLTYAYLAESYEGGPYTKQSAEYKEKYGGKDETPESKLALANVNQLIDRIIDAYARAVALAGSDPNKAVWMERLTGLYKFRHEQTEVGLDKLIAGILGTPLPPLPTPITVLPTPPAATPAAGSATGSSTPATNVAAPKGTQPATSTAPKPSPTPVKPPTTSTRPRTRRSHP